MEQERRIAVKFAYDGTRFFGFQRQPEKVTVEGELVKALSKIGAIDSPRECGYRSSSRTDRGVSAFGNVISLRTKFPLSEMCSAANSELEDVWLFSAVEVPEEFNPRTARQRWYRYYLPVSDQDERLMRSIADKFVGVHDFSSYARRDYRNPMRRIDSIEVSVREAFFAIDFKAESFLWNMVRRIVWMMNEGSSGRIPMETIGPEASRKPSRVGLSPPEYLVLVDIDCGIQFRVDPRAREGIRIRLDRRIRDLAMRHEYANSLRRAVTSDQPSCEG